MLCVLALARRRNKGAAVNTYQARVQVPGAAGHWKMVVTVQVTAQNTISARAMIDAQYGASNVVSMPVLVR